MALPDPISTGASAVTILDRASALVRWVFRRGPKPTLPAHHSGFEVKPLRFSVNLNRPIPSIEVELLAINYLKHSLDLREVKITRLNPGILTAIDNIPLAREVVLEPKSSVIISCERALADSEARVAATSQARYQISGSIGLVARALRRGKEITYGPVSALVIWGGIERQATGAA